MQEPTIKMENLKDKLRRMGRVVIAFSGGVDSTFLVKVAYEVLGKNVIAVTAASSTYPKTELEEAKRLARLIGVRHIIVNSEETEVENFKQNSPNRCYYCKKELFSRLKEIAKKEKINYVLDGTNYDDLTDFRPGMKALRELNIISPLKDVKLTKEDIRNLSKLMNLDTWDKPACACLASRFPYGIRITKERLDRVEKAENVIRNLGIRQLRVRYHNEIARIEVNKKDMQLLLEHSDSIVKKFKELGFIYVTLDMEGYRTGSLNEVLRNEGRDRKNVEGF
ncbi:ATP-dependent sacrificial sulfur transferase LarE [Candidatus Aerophobetes bacterium]|uniref:ATP-dependent sacrificial sulfur transferase LarE n=1 Tax=Aerophobetes bacterium TaxID=2030807 RepID=A0A497E7B4_UNCAE|nr:MAG: ATP-dependent sacrificial sulfur transferase LarE [Candidatus Aerophobetes bacterium]